MFFKWIKTKDKNYIFLLVGISAVVVWWSLTLMLGHSRASAVVVWWSLTLMLGHSLRVYVLNVNFCRSGSTSDRSDVMYILWQSCVSEMSTHDILVQAVCVHYNIWTSTLQIPLATPLGNTGAVFFLHFSPCRESHCFTFILFCVLTPHNWVLS